MSQDSTAEVLGAEQSATDSANAEQSAATDSGFSGANEFADRGKGVGAGIHDTADMSDEEGGSDGQDTDSNEDGGAGATEENYLGTYKTKEDAARGLSEAQKMATKASQEAAELRRQIEALKGADADKPDAIAERAKMELDQFVGQPKDFVRKEYARLRAEEKSRKEVFDSLDTQARTKAYEIVKVEYKDVINDDIHKAAKDLFNTDPVLIDWGKTVNSEAFDSGRGFNLEKTRIGMVRYAYTQAIAKNAAKMVQDASAKATRETKTNEKKKARLGVQQQGGRSRGFTYPGGQSKAEAASVIASIESVETRGDL